MLKAKLSGVGALNARLSGLGSLRGRLSTGGTQVEPYEGPYEVTPTQDTQILYTEELRATQNIVINPIPHNYGLITWNGIFLTVS